MPSFSVFIVLATVIGSNYENLGRHPNLNRVLSLMTQLSRRPRKKHVRAPVWHTLPSPSRVTFTSTVSSSQSTRMRSTSRRLPEVSPFIHSLLRVRLKNVAKPVSRVSRERLLVHEADHQHFVGVGVLDHRGNQSVQFREVHIVSVSAHIKKPR